MSMSTSKSKGNKREKVARFPVGMASIDFIYCLTSSKFRKVSFCWCQTDKLLRILGGSGPWLGLDVR